MTALGRAAGAFVEGGYDVFPDGVIGPWFLPQLFAGLRASAATPEYVGLRASLEACLARVCGRDGPGASARVRHMHRAFAELGDLERHALDTSTASADEVRARVEERRAGGWLRLTAPPVGPPARASAGPDLPQRRLIEAVRRRCREDSRVLAALLFGSFSRGEGDRHSDVDFYVFVDDAELESFDAGSEP